MAQSSTHTPLAVSCGDPAGIGPDIIVQAWAARDRHAVPPFFCIGDPEQLSQRAKRLELNVPIARYDATQTAPMPDAALPVMPLENRLGETPGVPDRANAAGIVEAIDRAAAITMSGTAAAMVTAPISKKPLYEAGFAHPGHTEYLAALAERHIGQRVHAVMMIAGPTLRTVPVTIHIPLAEVPKALSRALIIKTLTIVDADLKARFGLDRPRIVVAGLNPHAGEGGALGQEDQAIIAPAVGAARAKGIAVTGPLPADTLFHAAARADYDVAVCMYHDQALIPAKALDFDEGVNVTLGLPFIRTSPDHGTAFAIAGSGQARPDSFIAALKQADQMARFGQVK